MIAIYVHIYVSHIHKHVYVCVYICSWMVKNVQQTWKISCVSAHLQNLVSLIPEALGARTCVFMYVHTDVLTYYSFSLIFMNHCVNDCEWMCVYLICLDLWHIIWFVRNLCTRQV